MSAKPIAAITGLGTAVPPRVVPNSEFEKYLETSDQWIVERTGIRARHFAAPGVNTSDLGARAARQAIEAAGKIGRASCRERV